MDDLEKRRRLLADPDGHLKSLQNIPFDDLTEAQLAELKSSQALENQLKRAMNIDVPGELVDKIILKQRLATRKNRMLGWSIAASLAIVSMMSILMLSQPKLSLPQSALAHVYNEMDHLSSQILVTSETVTRQLAEMNVELPFLPKHITFAYPCGLDGEAAMHLIAQIDGKPVTLLITNTALSDVGGFGDGHFVGKIRNIADNGFIAIAEEPRLLDLIYQQITVPQGAAVANL